MSQPPLHKCAYNGCRTLVRGQARCEKHTKAAMFQKNDSRESSTERGYGNRWRLLSERYRNENPLCVECLFNKRVSPAVCVDHIIPHKKREELLFDTDNLCSLCQDDHGLKTRDEMLIPEWLPQPHRYVVCGLPGTGKTTRANDIASGLGCDVFDWDYEAEKRGLDAMDDEVSLAVLKSVRAQWIGRHRTGAAVLIVSRPRTAMKIAANMDARVIHCVCDETERHNRISKRLLRQELIET